MTTLVKQQPILTITRRVPKGVVKVSYHARPSKVWLKHEGVLLVYLVRKQRRSIS